MDTCSPEIARNNCDELCAIDKYNIDTPIKLENAKVEYQVQHHDESSIYEDTITTDNHNIDTPIKVQDFKVEYQVHKHDDSFSSCPSEVNNAQDYESASLQVPDLMS